MYLKNKFKLKFESTFLSLISTLWNVRLSNSRTGVKHVRARLAKNIK